MTFDEVGAMRRQLYLLKDDTRRLLRRYDQYYKTLPRNSSNHFIERMQVLTIRNELKKAIAYLDSKVRSLPLHHPTER